MQQTKFKPFKSSRRTVHLCGLTSYWMGRLTIAFLKMVYQNNIRHIWANPQKK